MSSAYKAIASGKRKRDNLDEPVLPSELDNPDDSASDAPEPSTSTPQPPTSETPVPFRNRQRLLILSSRGITHRHRHLLTDLHFLLPHSRREAKLESKSALQTLNELAELYNCNSVAYFEGRKGKDLYLWLARVPNGPTIKFFVQNLHTSAELNFTGNCLRGSRPVLSFDAAFESTSVGRVMREMFTQVFGVPRGQKRGGGKPFVDHVMGFSWVDGKVWVRVYEIAEKERDKVVGAAAGYKEADSEPEDGSSGRTKLSLTEIGPRFVLTPIIVQESSFGGPLIYENRQFVSPNAVRSELRRKKGAKFGMRTERQVERLIRKGELGLNTKGGKKRPRDEIDDPDLFA